MLRHPRSPAYGRQSEPIKGMADTAIIVDARPRNAIGEKDV